MSVSSRLEAVRPELDVPVVVDIIYLGICALSLIYVCFARSWGRALILSLAVAIAWVMCRAQVLIFTQHEFEPYRAAVLGWFS